MDNRNNTDQLNNKGEVIGVRPGSEAVQTDKKEVKLPAVRERQMVQVRTAEEAEEALINRPKPKNVTPLAMQKQTP